MRVKRGVTAHKRHQKVRKSVKGFSKSYRSSVRRSKQSITKSLVYATRDRKNKKRTFRQTWNTRINAGAKLNGTNYSKLIAALKAANVELDRKVLSELAVNEPKAFTAVVKTVIK